MKYMYIIDFDDGVDIKDKIYNWIEENEEDILEILNIEINENDERKDAIIFYVEREML